MRDFKRIFIEKKEGFNVEATELFHDFKDSLLIKELRSLRLLNIYEITGLDDKDFDQAVSSVFSEKNVDRIIREEELPEGHYISFEPLPGQFDQRADSAIQCLNLILPEWTGLLKSGKLLILEGNLSHEELGAIKESVINPVESREKDLSRHSLNDIADLAEDIPVYEGFIDWNNDKIKEFRIKQGFAMTDDDLLFCQKYFAETEKRDPYETELKVLDTYWSDHCRHSTFETLLENVEIESGSCQELFRSAYETYLADRKMVHDNKKPVTLMDMATLGMKKARKTGKLDDLDISDEINACSVKIDVDVNGKNEEWLLMFKNETHNHPTEIEPFGGASTCIGGAIRDPLSGRAYVYQAMRVTGASDPRESVADTLAGKLPQKKISKLAAHGYSSYGNQIGLATSYVKEIYHPGYKAKRMEVGAVVGAAPIENVVRKKPEAGDIVILLGGKTGRDGCGGATGSSKEHTEESLALCGAEVQKGNAPEERKIQRLFRNAKATRLIKKCNDFGAGGVSVAIGELSDGLIINLDKVPVKYKGLNGTELAISESQERMAVVISKTDKDEFTKLADQENLEATEVAEVTAEGRLRMIWRNKIIVDLDRAFLDTNGVRQKASVRISQPGNSDPFSRDPEGKSIEEKMINNLKDLNNASQKGLVEMFDGSIGSSTVHMPFGGARQMSESECSVHKLPVIGGETKTTSLISYGYNPVISSWSPFHGAAFAICESLAKLVASGGKWRKTRFSFQEYFRRMGDDPSLWGLPFSALLGAYITQDEFGLPAIGGKDSMSGSFHNLHVPPTLISFAVTTGNSETAISSELKKTGSRLYLFNPSCNENRMPDFKALADGWDTINKMADNKEILAAASIKEGGWAETLSEMCFGNRIGVELKSQISMDKAFNRDYGSIIIETNRQINEENFTLLGSTSSNCSLKGKDFEISLSELEKAWKEPLDSIFPDLACDSESLPLPASLPESPAFTQKKGSGKPRVYIPVFPGTNCEYDSERAFQRAGADTSIGVFRNESSQAVNESIRQFAQEVDNSQILMLSGGFSAGDEPEGSGKFIANILMNPLVSEAVMKLLDRDGLILGICNGFQALLKSGLLPDGKIGPLNEKSPTLARNNINRHVSRLVETRVVCRNSPWMSGMNSGERYMIAVSHGEGRFYADKEQLDRLFEKGMIAFQYVDSSGAPSMNPIYNPNGSSLAIEGIMSENGRILGKMGHSERISTDVYKNIPGNKNQPLFESGVNYFL